MFKVNNKDIRTTPTYFTPCSSVSIVNFEHINAGGVVVHFTKECFFGQFVDIKVVSLMPKFYLLAGGYKRDFYFISLHKTKISKDRFVSSI